MLTPRQNPGGCKQFLLPKNIDAYNKMTKQYYRVIIYNINSKSNSLKLIDSMY